MKYKFSKVELAFNNHLKFEKQVRKSPYITVNNFPKLGLLTSLRFLEWVAENPNGVISLPTGKTPEYFIKWTKYILQNWNNKSIDAIRKKYGLNLHKKT